MIKLAREIREGIAKIIEKSMTEVFATMHEEWLSADELCRQFQMFNPRLLKQHGDKFGRKRITMTGKNGGKYSSHWAYPRYRIAKNIADGVYDDMKIFEDIGGESRTRGATGNLE